jgi:hypothetical protein
MVSMVLSGRLHQMKQKLILQSKPVLFLLRSSLSDQLATKLGDGDADEAAGDSRDAGYDTAAGERKSLFYFGT